MLPDYSSVCSDRAPADRSPCALVRAFRENGGVVFSNEELVSLVIGSGRGIRSRAARKIVEHGGTRILTDRVESASWWDLLPPRQGLRLGAALELGRRLRETAPGSVPLLNTPHDVYEFTADLRYRRKEHFVGLYLNTRNRFISRETVSVGSLNASIVHPREVFEPAIRHGAASLIVVHNHPSGETDPSEEDVAITRRLADAAGILGIGFLDHVIVGQGGYTSLKALGQF